MAFWHFLSCDSPWNFFLGDAVHQPYTVETYSCWDGTELELIHVTLSSFSPALPFSASSIGSTSFLHVLQRTCWIEASSLSSLIFAAGAFHSPPQFVLISRKRGSLSLSLSLSFLYNYSSYTAQALGPGRCSKRSVALNLSCADYSRIWINNWLSQPLVLITLPTFWVFLIIVKIATAIKPPLCVSQSLGDSNTFLVLCATLPGTHCHQYFMQDRSTSTWISGKHLRLLANKEPLLQISSDPVFPISGSSPLFMVILHSMICFPISKPLTCLVDYKKYF